MWGL
jgi:DnaJ-class molecular chaperone